MRALFDQPLSEIKLPTSRFMALLRELYAYPRDTVSKYSGRKAVFRAHYRLKRQVSPTIGHCTYGELYVRCKLASRT